MDGGVAGCHIGQESSGLTRAWDHSSKWIGMMYVPSPTDSGGPAKARGMVFMQLPAAQSRTSPIGRNQSHDRQFTGSISLSFVCAFVVGKRSRLRRDDSLNLAEQIRRRFGRVP